MTWKHDITDYKISGKSHNKQYIQRRIVQASKKIEFVYLSILLTKW